MAPRLRARPSLAAPLLSAAGWALGAAAAALPRSYGAAITSAPLHSNCSSALLMYPSFLVNAVTSTPLSYPLSGMFLCSFVATLHTVWRRWLKYRPSGEAALTIHPPPCLAWLIITSLHV